MLPLKKKKIKRNNGPSRTPRNHVTRLNLQRIVLDWRLVRFSDTAVFVRCPETLTLWTQARVEKPDNSHPGREQRNAIRVGFRRRFFPRESWPRKFFKGSTWENPKIPRGFRGKGFPLRNNKTKKRMWDGVGVKPFRKSAQSSWNFGRVRATPRERQYDGCTLQARLVSRELTLQSPSGSAGWWTYARAVSRRTGLIIMFSKLTFIPLFFCFLCTSIEFLNAVLLQTGCIPRKILFWVQKVFLSVAGLGCWGNFFLMIRRRVLTAPVAESHRFSAFSPKK